MWKARFEDGYETDVYPEEVIPSEMKANGCNWFKDVLVYDRDYAERMTNCGVDVISPQENADVLGTVIKDGNKYYLPKNVLFGVDNIIRDAEARTGETDIEVKDRDLELD